MEPEFDGESRAIAKIGSHWLDVIEYIAGLQISEVFADFCTFFSYRRRPLNEVETFTGKIKKNSEYAKVKISTGGYDAILFKFSGGAYDSITINQVSAGRKNRLAFEIYGTKKSVAWNYEEPNEL